MLERRRRAACVIQRHVRGTSVRAQLEQQHQAAELVQVNPSLQSAQSCLTRTTWPALQQPGGPPNACSHPRRLHPNMLAPACSIFTISRARCRPSGEDGGHAGRGAPDSRTCGAACCDLQQPRLQHLTSSSRRAQRLPCSASCRASSMSRCRPEAASTVGWNRVALHSCFC